MSKRFGRFSPSLFALIGLLLIAFIGLPTAQAQSVAPAYASTYTIHVLGGITGLPTNYGGLVFKEGDPNTILIGGQANGTAGRFYAVPVIRGAGNHITGFGTPVVQGYGGNNDGGISYSPSGVLLYSKYNLNQVGQVKPGAATDSKVSNLASLSVVASPGALTFVPAGRTGAGKLKVCSFGGGQFYDVAYADDGNGTYNLTGATLQATLPGGPEGLIYAPNGSPLLTNGTLLVTEYNAGKVAAYDTDANGNPVLASRKDFITGLTGGEGAAIDPVTGDFFFSTFGSSNRVIRVQGFTPPPPAATVSVASSLNPSVAGQSITFTATVTGVAPISGTVNFEDGSTAIAGCTAVAVSSGVATCTTASLPVGTRFINAVYGGNSSNSPNHGGLTQTVTPANHPPVAGPMPILTYMDHAISGHLVADDADGTPLTFTVLTQPAHGTLTLTNATTGAATYTPTAGYTGTDSFTYKVNDGTVDSNIAKAFISVMPVPSTPNQLPLAGSDLYTTAKNTTLTVPAPGVLSNDLDPDGQTVQIGTIPSSPASHGTVTAGIGGGFTYVPAANYVGTDSFQYTLTDGTATSTGTVSLVITNTNTAPVAHNDGYTTPSNATLTVPVATGLLANDSDPDGNQPLSVVIASQPTLGTLVLTAGGGFEYTQNSAICNVDSTDSFTYYADDSVAYSNLATVTISIHCVNQAPVAYADSYTTAQSAQLAIPTPGVMINDTDPDGNPITAVIVTQPTHGALAFNPNGGFFYQAVTAGTDTFTYKVTDGALESAPVPVSITVTATNQPPLAAGDSFSTTKNAVLNVTAPGVLANDSDPDGNPLQLASVMVQPAHGTLAAQLDGSFIYTPTTNYTGLDSFIYAVTDGVTVGLTATVVIDVRNANFPPVAQNDSYTTPHDTPLTVTSASGLLANDSDPDGNQPLAVVIVAPPIHGTLALGVGGGFTYTPPSGNCSADSTDSFTYYANDSVVNSNLATVTINIHCTNTAPVANPDSYTIQQGVQLSVPASGVLMNDMDAEGNWLNFMLVTPPSSGAFAPHPDGSFLFTAPAAGTYTFTYQASDGALQSAPATVTINVTATNQPPLAGYDTYQTTANTPLSVAAPGVLANDIDPDGNLLTMTVVTQPSHGQLHFDPDGSFIYTPTAGYVGLDSFTYTASDGVATSPAATVVIEVRAPVVAATAIPTLSEWGMIVLSSLMAMFGFSQMRRRNGI